MARRNTFIFSQYRQHIALHIAFLKFICFSLIINSGILYLNQHHRSDVIYAYKRPLDCYTIHYYFMFISINVYTLLYILCITS